MSLIIYEDMQYLSEKYISIFSELENKKILLTGSSGMIMSYMAEFLVHLSHKYSLNIKLYLHGRNLVRMKQRHKDILDYDNVVLLSFDLLNPLDIDINFDYIIHGASPAGTKSFLENPVGTILPNVYGIKNILDFAKTHNSKVCFFSSNAIYGNVDKKTISENDYGIVDPLSDRACYIESKKLAEQLCIAYYKQYGVKTTIARIPFTYGPTYDLQTDTRALPRFIRNIIEDKDIEIFEDSTLLQYTYVADVISAVLYIILNENAIGQAYNIATSATMDMQQIIKTLISIDKCIKSKLILKEDKDNYYFKKDKNINLSMIDNKKLKMLGWKEHYNFESGLRRPFLGIQEKYNE